MIKFIGKRFIESVIIIFISIFITFILMNIIPENTATVMMNKKIDKVTYERLLKELELDLPPIQRFLNYNSKLLKGDFGNSTIMKRKVKDIILDNLPYTIKLSIYSIIIAVVIGVTNGILSTMFRSKIIDKLIMFFSISSISMPTFWMALIMQYILAYKMKLLPISGINDFKGYIIPSFVLGFSLSGEITRLLRSSLNEIMQEDYITFAKSKGVSKFKLFFNHGLHSALVPIMTIIVMQFTSLLGGAMITESIFGIPGLGTISISALKNRDLPLIQGCIIFSTLIVILGNFFQDIFYSVIDPRIRLE